MRIISDFKDYYDSASSYGIDTTLVYERKNKELFIPRKVTKIPKGEYSDKFIQTVKKFSKFESDIRIGSNGQRYHFLVLGCCGKFYPYIRKLYAGENDKFFTYKETMKDIEENVGPKKYFSLWVKDSVNNFFEFFNKFENDDIFIELKSPLIHFDFFKELIEINPHLVEVFPEFVKILPPFEMFNEVSQYLGNILVSSENSNIYLTDEQKATNHGFDKYSFRKEKKNGK